MGAMSAALDYAIRTGRRRVAAFTATLAMNRKHACVLAACLFGMAAVPTITSASDGGRRLEREASPYLLEHVRDDVEWHPWHESVFERAKDDQRLVLVSLGRFGAQSLRRLEREFFQSYDLAKELNRNFVCVKVDYDERPDVAAVALAVARLSRESPLTIPQVPLVLVLLPDGRPVWGAPLTPETRARLSRIIREFANEAERWALSSRAAEIAAATQDILAPAPGRRVLHARCVSSMMNRIVSGARRSREDGSFRPSHGALRFLLSERYRSDRKASRIARDLLEKAVRGGLHDHVGGGFHHATIDEAGRLPRFEKRLRDNALIAWALAQSHQRVESPMLREAALGILGWARRELLDSDGCFMAALDAGVGDVEGGFYLWTRDEIIATLGPAASARFFASFELGPRGILYRQEPWADVTAQLGALRARRDRRRCPAVDTRVFAGDNGLMISALAVSSRAFNRAEDRDLARSVALSVLKRLGPPASLQRSARSKTTPGSAFLSDYAAVALGLLDLHDVTGDSRWLEAAQDFVEEAIRRFLDPNGGFFETDAAHAPVVMRLKSIEDGEGLSGNGIMALALHRLAHFTGEARYDDLALRTVSVFREEIEEHSTKLATLVAAAADLVTPESLPASLVESHPAQATRGPVSVRVVLSRAQARRGETLEARVRLSSAEPWFVVGARSNSRNLASLSVAVLDPELVIGAPEYPPATTIRPAFDDAPLAVHVGQIVIVTPLRVPESAPLGERSVRVRVRYQTCDRSDCLPPESVVLEIPLVIE